MRILTNARQEHCSTNPQGYVELNDQPLCPQIDFDLTKAELDTALDEGRRHASLVRIKVTHPDGRQAIGFLSIGLSPGGRMRMEVVAKRDDFDADGERREARASVLAPWVQPVLRATSAAE